MQLMTMKLKFFLLLKMKEYGRYEQKLQVTLENEFITVVIKSNQRRRYNATPVSVFTTSMIPHRSQYIDHLTITITIIFPKNLINQSMKKPVPQ